MILNQLKGCTSGRICHLYTIFRIHLDLGCFSKLYSGDDVYFHNLSIRFRLANYLFETTGLAKIFIQVFPYDAMENQTELFGQSNTMHTTPPFPHSLYKARPLSRMVLVLPCSGALMGVCECGKWAGVMPNTHSESVFWELLIGCPSLQSACPIPHLLTQQSRKEVCALPSFCMWCLMKKYQPHLSSLGRQDSWPADITEDNIGRSYEWSLQTICKVLSQTLPNVVLLDWISPEFSKEVDGISIF